VTQGEKTRLSTGLGAKGIAFLAILLFVTIVSRGNAWWTRMVPPGRGNPVEAVIEPGQSALAVARSLVAQGLTEGEARALARWFSLLGVDKRLKPGLYKIRPGTPWEVAKQIQAQEPDSAGIRLLPGTTLTEIGGLLSQWGGESALRRELSATTNFPDQIQPFLPSNPDFRLAFLLPDTYRVTPSEVAVRELVRLAANNWWGKVGAMLPDGFDSKWVEERAILASINERESSDDSERARVAGVFENRLRLGMPLQSCATVVFAWRQRGKVLHGLSYTDLQIDSPYNTYRNKGLPPGPIGIPSLPAWEAALFPEHHDFLFFVLSASGKHLFSKTYEEHLAAQKNAEKENRTGSNTRREPEEGP